MPEDFEENEHESSSMNRVLSVLRRRHMQFLLPFLAGWLVVWAASWVLPATYKSGTLILVQQPAIPKNYVVPNISDDLQERLQSITQQILSRTRLLLIIDHLHLYEGGRRSLNPDDKVDRMRKDITIDLVRNPQTNAITAFKISYSAPNARLAQEVTGELTKLFINANLEVRQQQSQDTTEFLKRQLADAQAGLAEQERKVRDFESAHQRELPSQQASNIQILTGLQQQLQNEQDMLNTATQQRAYLQSMAQQQTSAFAAGARSPDGTPTGLAAIDQQLETLRTKLTDLRSRYSENHPDVQALRLQIAKTEKLRDDYVQRAKNSAASGHGGEDSFKAAAAATGNPLLLQMQSQLEANRIEIANRQQAIASLKVRIDGYQARLNAQPAAEQELAELTRGYTQSKQIYDDLLKKESDSEMATSMEQMQQGERFAMLDPPSLPLKPDFPNRMKFCGIGIGFGLALGLGIVGLLELFDDRLYSDHDIRMLLPVDVLSDIPEIRTPDEERRMRRRSIRGWATATAVLLAILAGSAITYLHN